MYSDDKGATWTATNASEASGWRGVAYGDGVWVAVANSGTNRVMYSEDNGVTWTSASASEQGSWYKVAYGDGRFVAVSSSTSNIDSTAMYSEDNGKTWYKSNGLTSGYYNIKYANGMFVAVGNGVSAWSEDGITWVETTPSLDILFQGLAYGNGKWAAIATNGTYPTRSMYSLDGKNWTTETTLTLTDNKVYTSTGGEEVGTIDQTFKAGDQVVSGTGYQSNFNVFASLMYLGNGSSQDLVTGVDSTTSNTAIFIKNHETTSTSWRISDTINGTGKTLSTNSTGALSTVSYSVNQFYDDGFRINSSNNQVNENNHDIISFHAFSDHVSLNAIGEIENRKHFELRDKAFSDATVSTLEEAINALISKQTYMDHHFEHELVSVEDHLKNLQGKLGQRNSFDERLSEIEDRVQSNEMQNFVTDNLKRLELDLQQSIDRKIQNLYAEIHAVTELSSRIDGKTMSW